MIFFFKPQTYYLTLFLLLYLCKKNNLEIIINIFYSSWNKMKFIHKILTTAAKYKIY